MKRKLYNYIKKSFSKVITIPPSLNRKNPLPKSEEKDKLSPLYQLLQTEKIADNKNEALNLSEKHDYEAILAEHSQKMLVHYCNTQYVNNAKSLKNLAEFLKNSLNPKELNQFFVHLKETKKILESDDIVKTKEIFHLFIDKLYNITTKKNINHSLINLLSKLSLKDISPSLIFKNDDKNKDEFKMEGAIYFSQIEEHQKNHLKIHDPLTNDLFKNNNLKDESLLDAFNLSHDHSFTSPLIVQRKSHLTKFDNSNFVYFNMLPFLYPIENINTKEVSLKHLNNEIIISNNINLKENTEFESFLIKYLRKGLSSYFPNLNIRLLNVYNIKSKLNDNPDFMTQNLLNESLDFLSVLNDDMSLVGNRKDKRRKAIEGETPENQSSLVEIEKLIVDARYNDFRRQELERQIKINLKESLYYNGLIFFDTYEEKKKFLRSSIGYFGLHLQGKNIKFFDADFCNTLNLNQIASEQMPIAKLVKILNLQLKFKNFQGPLLEIPNYINELLAVENIEGSESVFLRFNSFTDALAASEIFAEKPINKHIRARLGKPIIRFYNNQLISGYELVFKNTIVNLQKILTTNANYTHM